MVTAPAKHLLVNTGELAEGKTGVLLKCSPDSLGPEGLPVRIQGDVSCEFTLEKSGERVDIYGVVGFAYVLECSRCLKEFVVQGSEKVLLHCRRSSTERAVREVELSEEDVTAYFYKDNIIDLAIAVRDAVLLSVPMKPLCSADCRGLCPVCGEDLNLKKCSCTVTVVDARWEALKELKSNTGRH